MDKNAKSKIIEQINQINKNTLLDTLNIICTDRDEESITFEMEVTSKVYQPMGIMNGGISGVLAESAGSILASKDAPMGKTVVGVQVICNHIKSVSSGKVIAKATYIKKGRTTQITQIIVTNENGDMISHNTLTTMYIDIR